MAGRKNTFTGPYEYDIGKGDSAFISAALITLRDKKDTKLPEISVVKQGDVVRAQAADRGPVTGEFVYFRRGGGTVTQALMDDLLGPDAFPSWPSVGGFTLVYSPEWWPVEEHGDMPAFQVKRASYGTNMGGDWVRGSTNEDLPNAVLKYPTSRAGVREAVVGHALLYVTAAGYDSVQIEWNWPDEEGFIENWKEVALVRSQFGVPTTPNDGQTLFRRLRKEMTDKEGNLVLAPLMYDTPLSSGYWYYYTLFFNISPHAPDLGDWVTGSTDWVQVPRDYGHQEHLWNGLPPYYQWVDDNQFGNPLKTFLKPFGFELDSTRQSVECMQYLYHIDVSPIPLLKEIGNNFNMVEEQGLGDIRFRASMADLAERLNIRGTQKGLQQTIETMSKYDTDVTLGSNLMLLPDDSSPFFSVGNWAGRHPNYPYSAVAWDQVSILNMPPDSGMPKVGEQGFLRITAAVAGDILATCGCGKVSPAVMTLPPNTRNLPGEYIPLMNAIPVEETGRYGFAAYLRKSASGTIPYVTLLWFKEAGQPSSEVLPPGGDPPHIGTPPSGGAPTDGTFRRHDVQGKAPIGATYLVPAILIQGRPTTAAYVDATAMMVYMAQPPGTAFDVPTPDTLLKLATTQSMIGAPPNTKTGDPNWAGFNIGAPIANKKGKAGPGS